MKLKITMLILFIGLNSIAQIKFEKGLFINNNGEKINCLIKNEQWENNPSYFFYKISDNSAIEKGSLGNVKEFRLKNYRFIRATVNIDKSSQNNNNLDDSRIFSLEKKTVFLKILVEGSASLYNYSNNLIDKFYYGTSSGIKLLKYKKYLFKGKYIKDYNLFQFQLKKELICNTISQNNYTKLKYTQNSLAKFFIRYNNCINPEHKSVSLIKKDSTKRLRFNLKVGGSLTKVSIQDNYLFNIPSNVHYNFDPSYNYILGADFEFILPIQRNKWSVFFEVLHEPYGNKNKDVIYTGHLFETKRNHQLNLNFMNYSFGIKHYFNLNPKNKLFLGLFYSHTVFKKSSFKISNVSLYPITQDDRLKKSYLYSNLTFGYLFNNKFSIELRNRSIDLFGTKRFIDGKYKSFQLVISYNLL